VPELSNGNLDDEITTVNIIALVRRGKKIGGGAARGGAIRAGQSLKSQFCLISLFDE
jgi:hypothetical protein